MQQQKYQMREQTKADERCINEDPREMGRGMTGEGERFATLPPRPRRRSGWLVLALCLLALLTSASILGMTDALSFASLHQSLPARAFTISGHGQLIVNDGGGNLHIRRGSTNQVIIQGEEYAYGLGSRLNQTPLTSEQQANTVTLTIDESWIILGSERLDVTVTVPDNLDVIIHGRSADADLTNIDGKVNIDANSGDITLNQVSGPVDLSTHSGDITLSNERSGARVHSDSGDITLNQVSGPVDLSSNSGDITLNQVSLSGQGQISTGSGDITVSGSLDPRSAYQMTTSNGDITLNLPAASSFQLSTSTDNGDVRNDFAAETTGTAPRATLALRTGNGDITLHKR